MSLLCFASGFIVGVIVEFLLIFLAVWYWFGWMADLPEDDGYDK